MTTTNDTKNCRVARVRELRIQIAAGEEQLDEVHELLMSGKLSHEEYLRMVDHRNNLILSIEQKEQELELVMANKKSNFERVNYNY